MIGRLLALFCVIGWLGACAAIPPGKPSAARQVEWAYPDLAGLPPGHVTVWLPQGYDDEPDRRYPVLYMWDGQNLFDPALTQYNKAWLVQDVLGRMVAENRAEPHIVVGVWSPPGNDRYRVYMPQKVAERLAGPARVAIDEAAGGPYAADRELAWVANEVKPRVDRDFRTRREARDTTVVGASMGGLMACYAAMERPDVFSRAGCVSIPFAPLDPAIADAERDVIERAWADYLGERLGPPAGRRIWMDHGTVGIDAAFAPWQIAVASKFDRAGWIAGRDYAARSFPGAEHDENFWRARMPEMLAWLWR